MSDAEMPPELTAEATELVNLFASLMANQIPDGALDQPVTYRDLIGFLANSIGAGIAGTIVASADTIAEHDVRVTTIEQFLGPTMRTQAERQRIYREHKRQQEAE